jgi:hypothetical protein
MMFCISVRKPVRNNKVVSVSPVILRQKFERGSRVAMLKGWAEGFRNAR